MALADYFKRRRVLLTSPLAPKDIVRRLNRADDSRFTPSGEKILGGGAIDRISVLIYPYPLALGGTLNSVGDRTELRLVYGPPWLVYLLHGVYYLAVIAAGLPGALAPQFDGYDAFLAFFGIAPIGVLWVFVRSADEKLQWLLDFLELEVEATPTRGSD